MNLYELEAERKRELAKYVGIILISLAVIASIMWMTSNHLINQQYIIFTSIIVIFVIYIVICDRSKKFENKLKKALLPSVLKNIAGNKGEIFWEDGLYLFDEGRWTNDCQNNIYQNYINSVSRKISSEILINKLCFCDDVFYGKYANSMFNIIEYDDIERHGKQSTIVIRGNILEIPLKIRYSGKLVIKEPKFLAFSAWEHRILIGLEKMKCADVFANKKLRIYAYSAAYIQEILTSEFIEFINGLPRIYTVAVAEGNLYIIANSNRDRFKLGSLCKNVNDAKQYARFKADLQELLNIVERVSRLQIVKTVESV